MNEVKPGWLGDRDRPEDGENHEYGKWCYIMSRHCEHAIITEQPCDCEEEKE